MDYTVSPSKVETLTFLAKQKVFTSISIGIIYYLVDNTKRNMTQKYNNLISLTLFISPHLFGNICNLG